MPIQLKDILFGQIDAKNEVFQQDRLGVDVFKNSFQVPPGINIDDLIKGSKFFISGQKGCGKTALLLHLNSTFKDMGADITFLLFKSGISEQERQQIAKGSDYQLVEQDGKFSTAYDYELNWIWYIYRNILRKITKGSVLKGWDVAESLRKLMGVDNELDSTSLSHFNSKQINANAKVGINAGPFTAEIGADVELIHSREAENTATAIIEIVERYFDKISVNPRNRKILIFDELELFWNRKDQRERDLFLIRDLIKSVARANRIIGKNTGSVLVIAAIRSEVLIEVNRVGPEVSRDVDDCGVKINWNVRADALSQPILRIVEAKIVNSEISENEIPSSHPWDVYFPNKIFNRKTQNYLLDISMFKPRNIVSLLNLARDIEPEANVFSSNAFEEAQAEFSKKTWREIEEELLGEYSVEEVKSIKSILSAFQSKFDFANIEERVIKLYQIDSRLKPFLLRERLVLLIESLYRVGALGNDFEIQTSGRSSHRYRWAFRENSEPALDKQFVVHESIRKELQLTFEDV
jgi:DNA polymerase III delta prime subunit